MSVFRAIHAGEAYLARGVSTFSTRVVLIRFSLGGDLSI